MIIEIERLKDILDIVKNLRGVIFDLDDTLYNEREYVFSGFKAIGQAFPQYPEIENLLEKAFRERKPAIDTAIKVLNIPEVPTKQKMLDIYRTHFPQIRLNPDAGCVLAMLKNQGFKTGLITDGRPEGQHNKIRALDIDSYFDKIIITDELGGIEFRKPNPHAFILMHDSLRLDYKDLCYVGDNKSKDFDAPEQLGMLSIHFINHDGLYCSVK